MKTPLKENIQFKNSRIVKDLIPAQSKVHSFLLYDGNIELKLAASNRQVIAHTNNYVVHEFWECALENPRGLGAWVRNLSSLLEDDPVFSSNKMFTILQDTWPSHPNSYTRAAFFFLLNRCSDVGLVSSGKFADEGLNSLAIINLERLQIKNFELCLDKTDNYLDGIQDVPADDYLLFPAGRYSLNLFEKGKSKGIESTLVNHRELCSRLKSEQRKWVALYKPHPRLREMYEDYNLLMIDEHGRQTTKEGRCEDVVIANF